MSGTSAAIIASSEFKPFVSPSPVLKGLFVGSGSDGMSDPRIVDAVLSLADTPPSSSSGSSGSGRSSKEAKKNVLYLGTATYDRPEPRQRQTQGFIDAGCTVQSLDLVDPATPPSITTMEKAVLMADIILVSGGNTLYAVDLWKRLGLDDILYQKGMLRGAVLTGGSAGAICWFQGGHSDSMDPASYKKSLLATTTTTNNNDNNNDSDGNKDESSSAPLSKEDTKEWQYIRVDGLGFLPGLICPHHDKAQSNGILRSDDFDDMLLRHPTEFGIGIDHWAALEITSNQFRVISLDDKEGSVVVDAAAAAEDGTTNSNHHHRKPGIWCKQVIDNKVHKHICPTSGNIQDLLFHVPSQQHILKDPRVDICRRENPNDNKPPPNKNSST